MMGAVKAQWWFSQCYRSCVVNWDWFDYQIALKQEKTMLFFQINRDIKAFWGAMPTYKNTFVSVASQGCLRLS